MAIEVKIPPMGESISSGVLAKWHVKDGSAVKRDQVLYELETDKITSEGLAEESGRISIQVGEGEEVSIGQVVAQIDPGALPKEAPAESAPPKSEEKPAAPKGGSEAKAVSPAVRRIASETGIDPSQVSGTGKRGRVTKGDMLAAADSRESGPETPAAPAAEPAPPAPAAPAQASSERTTRKKMSPLRQRIAQRLVASQREAAILTTFNEVDLSAVRDLRARHQEAFTAKHGIKLGFMSFFIKATVQALKEVPALNARIEGDSLVHNHFYDIGVAVSTEKGLLVPVVRSCDQLGFAELEKQLADFARKAREGKVKMEDLEGGVFTISNGGVFGSLLSTPIINPPQSGILGMHTIQDRPVAVGGQVVIRPMMYLALSYDHRVVDGREAVTFLVKVKQFLEDPGRLLLGL